MPGGAGRFFGRCCRVILADQQSSVRSRECTARGAAKGPRSASRLWRVRQISITGVLEGKHILRFDDHSARCLTSLPVVLALYTNEARSPGKSGVGLHSFARNSRLSVSSSQPFVNGKMFFHHFVNAKKPCSPLTALPARFGDSLGI